MKREILKFYMRVTGPFDKYGYSIAGQVVL